MENSKQRNSLAKVGRLRNQSLSEEVDVSFKAQLKCHQVLASLPKPEAYFPLGSQSTWLLFLF